MEVGAKIQEFAKIFGIMSNSRNIPQSGRQHMAKSRTKNKVFKMLKNPIKVHCDMWPFPLLRNLYLFIFQLNKMGETLKQNECVL